MKPLKDWQERSEKAGYRFECPVCHHIATPEDFKKLGVDPERAAQECIGRYIEGSQDAFTGNRKGPCNFAAYGLFRLGEVITMPDGREVGVMPPASEKCEAVPA